MSRVGKKPIVIPNGVEVKINDNVVDIKSSKGQLQVEIPQQVKVAQENDSLVFTIANLDNKSEGALWGLARSLVNNAVVGVTEGFSKSLELNGVGFKVVLQGKNLVLNVGFSHQVEYNVPEGITAEVEKNKITISGIDKQQVGQVAAEIRKIKKPEPYKGKGIKYSDEIIRRKAGKVVKA
ncbi:50S ribosomal protein L6 [bacterium]|jgi:large subunit ribosomal protein L6|nr:50S ribosomal protein L6 [bacterium]